MGGVLVVHGKSRLAWTKEEAQPMARARQRSRDVYCLRPLSVTPWQGSHLPEIEIH